ncbi:MAG: D-aminoacylase [Chloroflexi bacterium]|nr:MAG: D-aminoacylase [Chloroflexota bacterium]
MGESPRSAETLRATRHASSTPHDDDAVMSTCMDFKLLQGVTTNIVGNCGTGMAPRDPSRPPMPGVNVVLGARQEGDWQSFGEYMDAVDRAELAVNVGCFVPHGAVRYFALGMERREPDDAELGLMRDAVAEGMAAGALGLSTGLIYPPGAFAKTEEIVALAAVAAEHGGIYMTHMRDEAEQLLEAIEEAVRIARGAWLPLEISHHKAGRRENWGKTEQSIALIEKEREAGVDVTFDAYPYTAGSTILAVMARRPEAGPDSVMVSSVRGKPEFEGKTLTQIAEMLGVAPDEAAPRVLEAYPSAVAVFFMMDEADVRRVLAHSLCMVGSDGIPSRTGKPHPRLYGTFPRVLGKYVREERLFSLEEGVRQMTSLPARRMNLAGRGELREGFAADVVVFDPKTIADRATYEEPRKYPAGIDYVIVNGEIGAEHGKQTAARSGRLLRGGSAV